MSHNVIIALTNFVTSDGNRREKFGSHDLGASPFMSRLQGLLRLSDDQIDTRRLAP